MPPKELVREPYERFLESKAQANDPSGFVPIVIPDYLFDYQKPVTEFNVVTGRAQMVADCGLGKTAMYYGWLENTVRKGPRGRALFVTPLGLVGQTIREGEKFGVGVEVHRSTDGKVRPGVNVVNVDRLHYFDPDDFDAVVYDESSGIKNFKAARQKVVTDFLRRVRWRLFGSGTVSPNCPTEFGTASEALGYMGYMDVLAAFFKNEEKSMHPTGFHAKWLFKAHAEMPYYRYLASFTRAFRKPSDLGFSDAGYELPPLELTEHSAGPGVFTDSLFPEPVEVRSTAEMRALNRSTLRDRCERMAEALIGDGPAVAWVQLNDEAALVRQLMPGACEIHGGQSEEEREEILLAFITGQVQYVITKPGITAFGQNWQHCNRFGYFPNHSFEQYYQLVRRFWRFGQLRPVHGHLIVARGAEGVIANVRRKEGQTGEMYDRLIEVQHDAAAAVPSQVFPNRLEVPAWLC